MLQPLYILFGALFTAAVSIAAGKLLLRGLGIQLHRVEEGALAFVTGSALLSSLVFLLATLKLARKGVFLAAGVAIIGLAVARGAHRLSAGRLPRIPRLYLALLWIALAVFGVVYLANSMAPEKSPDGATYHLGIVGRFDRAHGFERITTNMYANLSLATELLFWFAYSFGRHSAAGTLHLCFLFALVALMVCYGQRFGFPRAGVAGAVFLFLTPVVGIDAVSAYNDVALAAILFGLFYVLQLWDADRRSAWMIPAGLLAGFAYAVKYTGFLALPYAVGFVLWKLWRARKPWFRPAATVVACALVMIAPWVVKNWIWIGNPLSPFFNSVFPNPYVHISFEKDYSESLRVFEGVERKRDIPIEVTVTGRALGGILGPLFLLSPLALLSLRSPAGRRLLLGAALFALPYAANVGTRFLIPSLPFLSIALALGLLRAPGLTPLVIVVHGILAWPPVLTSYNDKTWRIERVPHKQALRMVPEEEFLSERLRGYIPARLIERHTPDGARVFCFSPVPEAYTTRDIIVGFQSAPGHVLRDILLIPIVEDYQPRHHFEMKFEPAKLRRVRVRQTNTGNEIWSITEIRLFARGQEVPRSRAWKASSYPNPWDVELVLDRNPATRWKSWQSIDDRMYFEIDFGEPIEIDTVRVEASSDQWQVAMALDVMDEPRGWRDLGAFPDLIRVTPPDGLRRASTTAVRARGVDYLLMYDYDFTGDDMRARPEDWGIAVLAEGGGARLYRIE